MVQEMAKCRGTWIMCPYCNEDGCYEELPADFYAGNVTCPHCKKRFFVIVKDGEVHELSITPEGESKSIREEG